LGTTHEWRVRKEFLFPKRAHCLCCLKKVRDEKGYPTLGLFRPKSIDRLIIKPSSSDWTQAQLAILRQEDLFEKKPPTELEKIPFNFRYEFKCNHSTCAGHKMFCSDWEIGQAFRKWKAEYGDRWESKFRQKFETDMIQKYDTHFYVGTVAKYPGTWIIVGLFYPPRSSSGILFEQEPQSVL